MDVDNPRKVEAVSPPHMATLTDTLIELIDSSGLPLIEIANKAGVPYQSFRRWVKGRRGDSGRSNRTLDADSADAVYKVLTGKSYTEGAN